MYFILIPNKGYRFQTILSVDLFMRPREWLNYHRLSVTLQFKHIQIQMSLLKKRNLVRNCIQDTANTHQLFYCPHVRPS